jgi:tRNA uridine 5-carboxymethylaminomethyl modification enzyme
MFHVKQSALAEARDMATTLKLSPSALAKRGVAINQDGVPRSALELLAYPGMSWDRLIGLWPELAGVTADIAEQLTIDARYDGYLDRQRLDIAAYRRDEALELPVNLDYRAVGGLSNEVRQKLETHRPATLGQAARISGITPAALVGLLKYVRRRAA